MLYDPVFMTDTNERIILNALNSHYLICMYINVYLYVLYTYLSPLHIQYASKFICPFNKYLFKIYYIQGTVTDQRRCKLGIEMV